MRVSGPTLDAADPIALAEFYERLLGWSIARREGPRPRQPSTDGWALLRSPAGDMKIEVQWDPHSLTTRSDERSRAPERAQACRTGWLYGLVTPVRPNTARSRRASTMAAVIPSRSGSISMTWSTS